MTRKIYIIGSLRNPGPVAAAAKALREVGWIAFDDWSSAGPTADDCWMEYEKNRGHNFREALDGLSARHTFEYDKHHLQSSDAGLLVLPAGSSCHLELGYLMGLGKPGYFLLPEEPTRFDVMYKFAAGIFHTIDEMVKELA